MEQAEKEMDETSDEQRERNSIRKYLLGKLEDAALMRQIEKKTLLDESFAERLAIAEDELIEDYLDEALTESELEQFLRFFLITPENREKLRLTKNLRKYAAKSSAHAEDKTAEEKKRFFFDWRSFSRLSPALRFSVIALVFCGIGFIVWRIGFYESGSNRGLAELRRVYRESRPFESRLTVLDYSPFLSTRGGGNSTATEEARLRDSAALKLLEAAQNQAGAESFHALANYYLTEKQFDKAIAHFEEALKLDANNAQLHNDYGVALLEKAKQIPEGEQSGKRLENLAGAYEHFTRAVELNDSLPEGLFNRALALQQMNLPEQAKRAWRDYLEKDSSSKWADEARKNLEQLETQAISSVKPPEQVLADFFAAFERGDEERAWQIVSQTREMITGTMVFFQLVRGFLAEGAADRSAESEKYLAAMRFVGKIEKERGGDFYFSELAEFYASTNPPDRQILLQAQNQVKAGYRLSQSSKYSEAIKVFLEAKELFSKAGNSWESNLSDYWLGFLRDRTGKNEESDRKFLALENYSRSKKHGWLAAQFLNGLFNFTLARNEYSKALNFLTAALKITRKNSDAYNRQKILAQLGNYYSRLGELQKALSQIEESRFTSQNYFSSDRQSWRNCLFAAETLYKLKLYNSAIAFGQEAFVIGNEKISESTANHTSYYMLAQLYGGAGKFNEAIDYARKSLHSVESVKKEDGRLLTNYSNLRTAHLYRQMGNCEESLKIYSEVTEETTSREEEGAAAAVELELNNYEARKGRLLCYFALNRADLIEEELSVVLNLYEKFRAQIHEEQTRNVFFDNEQSVYDLAINFERSRNKIENSFATAEISKARSLLSLFETNASLKENETKLRGQLEQVARPLDLGEIQQRLPVQVQLVQYAVLPDKIFIWVVTRTEFHFIEKQIASSSINREIDNYLKIISENKFERRDTPEEAHQLYQALISPVLPLLDANKVICIIPDKMLYRLPFAALVSPATGQYLIEDYTVFSAPSASMLVLSSEAATRKSASDMKDEKILSVGNPQFNRREFPDLPDLPGAEKEALKVATFYKSAKTLTGKSADKQAVLSEIAGSDVFHFAGHYVVDESSPLRSRLLLAQRQENQSPDAAVEEILGQNLGPVKLAVLSACRTGTENYYGGEGMFGIARSFLAGGVPLVIASQWAVDSEATAELIINFHLYRKQHRLSSSEALRRAQLEMLKNSTEQRYRMPYYWAGFLPIGGYTDN